MENNTISKTEFISSVYGVYFGEYPKEIRERVYKVVGGAAFINYLNRQFEGNINKEGDIFFHIKSINMDGIGELLVEHNPLFDSYTSRSILESPVNGYPENSYKYDVYIEKHGSFKRLPTNYTILVKTR